jgi:hypothetical protein
MADVIQFKRKAQNLKHEKEEALRRRKVETLRKIFKCTRCAFRCAKCGASLEDEDRQGAEEVSTPYSFCSTCREEYLQYRERTREADAESRYYWQNDAWMEVWRSWLEHQKRLDDYRRSKEFLQLLGEVESILNE